MIVIVSDLHLGKTPENDESSLSELCTCLRSFQPDLKKIIFLGDVFDAFIEYPGRLPESVERWSSLVRELQEYGIEVRSFAGNHDRWYSRHLESLLGGPVWRTPVSMEWRNLGVWMEHGDLASPHSLMVKLARSFSDQRWVLSLYRTVLPFGWGQTLAAYVSRKYSNFEPDEELIGHLKTYAEGLIREKPGSVVIMGHSHRAGFERVDKGVYVNTGDWYGGRTFAVLSEDLRLCRWSPKGVEVLEKELFLNG